MKSTKTYLIVVGVGCIGSTSIHSIPVCDSSDLVVVDSESFTDPFQKHLLDKFDDTIYSLQREIDILNKDWYCNYSDVIICRTKEEYPLLSSNRYIEGDYNPNTLNTFLLPMNKGPPKLVYFYFH